MASRDKAPRRPSLGRVLILGGLTALVGLLLAIADLARKPAQEVRTLPEEGKRVPGIVYYVKGNESSSGRWRTLRNQLQRGAPGTIVWTEADLNAWAEATFARPVRRAVDPIPDEAPEPPAILGIEVEVKNVNFRFVDDRLQMAANLELPDLLPGQGFLYQVRGQLRAESGGGLHFSPEEGTLGSAPVARVPILGTILHRTLSGLLENAPAAVELGEELKAVTGVEIAENTLSLTIE